MTKLNKSNCDKTQILTKLKKKLGQNSKTQIVTELKNSNCDKTEKRTQIVTIFKNSNYIAKYVYSHFMYGEKSSLPF